MSDSLNKIPVSPITSFGNPSVPNGSTFGTNFSILQTGGYMEVYTLSGLTYTILSTPGINEYSGNSIPIQFTKGSGSVFSPDVLTLNSDNISSGRRKLGMLVYVYETDKIYQFNIKNYDTLWSNATGATGPGGPTVVMSDYGTTVKNNSAAGIALINAWTTSTISGVNGYNDTNASWAILQTQSITGGTYFQGNTTFTNSTGGTFNIFGPSNYDPGVISGETWTDNSNGSINLPQITVALFNNPNFFEPLKFYSIPSGTTGVGSIPALLNNDTNYVIVEYNNGSPRYNVLDNDGTVDWSSVILYMIIYRADNFVHILEFGNMGSGLSSKMNDRIISTDRFARESGCSLGLSGSTGVVTLSSGVVWNGPNRQIVNGVTSMGLFFKNYHSGGTWVYTTTAHTINNLYYDNGTNLVLATGGKYLVNWYFRGQELNDHLYEVVSSNQYDSVLGAEASNEPNLPELIISHAFLVGRIIIAVSATTGITQSAFTNVFQPSGASGIHNDLIGLQGGLPNEYYHLDSNKYNNLALTNTNNNFSVGQTFLSGLTATTITANNISGTTNYVSKFTGANSLGNSLIYDNGTNVGIGTTSPTGKLDVLGIATSSPSATVTAGDLVVDTANRTVYIGKQSNASSDNTSFIFRDRLGARKSYWENASSGNISFGNFGTNYGVSIATSTLSFGVTSPARLVVDSGLSTFPSAVFTTGNVGIGTTSPDFKLDVVSADGTIANRRDTNTATFGSNVASYLKNSANVWTRYGDSGGGIISNVAGSEAGMFTIRTMKAGTITEAVRVDDNGDVGIGTTNPNEKLHVYGTSVGINIDGTTAARTYYNRNGSYIWSTGLRAGDTKFHIYDERSTDRFVIDDSGNVGIGITSPTAKLQVSGSTQVGLSSINASPYTNGLAYVNPSGTATSLFLYQAGVASGHVGFRASDNNLYIVNSYTNGLITNPAAITLTSTGNVGIGTTSPSNKLDVSGTSKFTGLATFDVDAVINEHNIGKGGGSLLSNFRAGNNALAGNTTGINNNAIGFQTFMFNTTGSNNLALGDRAGKFIADGTTNLTNAGTSLFLGALSKALSNTQTNQIVIGYNSTGLGSNTTVLGNLSTVTAAIYGNLLLGTTVDTGQELQVSGNTIINGGLTATTISATTINASNISGTTNYVSKFTGANSLGNSVVYDNGTNVGIGTTSPTAKLHVSTVNGTESSIILGQELTNRWKFKIPASSTSLVLGDVGGDYVYFLSSGNIGIGTSTPSNKLDVSGTTRITGTNPTPLLIERTGGSNSNIQFKNDANSMFAGGRNTSFGIGPAQDLLTTSQLTVFGGTGNVVIQNGGTPIDNGYRLDISGTSRHNGQTTITGTTSAITNLAQGVIVNPTLIATANNDVLVGLDIAPNYVGGVGTTNTIVGGTLYTTGTYTLVPLTGGNGTGAVATIVVAGGAVTTVTITTPGSGYYLGNTLSAAAANIGSTGSGFTLTINTLSAGTNVKPMGLRVDGIPICRGGGYVSGNFAMGIDALRNNTIGINNIGIGLNALLQNSNGSQNTAIGNYSLQNNQNSQNTSIGYASLISLSNGSANTSIGNGAGRYIANGSTLATNINNSIFIGLNAFPLADTQTNQIVIGTSSTGLGSNTTVLGNSSTITTAIYGDLLLGTTSDSGTEKLQVVGSAKISHTGATPLIIERTSSSTNTNIQFKNDVNSLFIGQMDNSNIGIGPSQNLVASSQLTVFGNTGNVIIQNGGTPVDTGYRLDVSGTTRLNGQTRISGTTSAITNLAQGVIVNPTLVATANNDVLVGMDINTNYVGGVGSVNTIVGGSSYTGTSYTGVPLTGGTGTGAIATIFINPSGAVSAVTITTAGSGYYLGNVLGTSGTTLGTVGSGFNLTVNTLSKTGVKPIGLRVDGINIGRGGGYNNTNTAVGNGAGLTNTTGNQNTFIGYIAGLTNTTGVQNTALGASALYFNVGGNSNTAIGANTLSANVTGFQNTSIGSTSLSLLTSGANNISLGFTSGRYIADGTTSLLNSNTSIFIGDFTKALASSQTNQIVIGHNSTGLGSNTTVLGNSSTVTTAIYGRTLLGTTTDNGSSILQVQGTTTSDGPTLGTELATTATGTNWVGTSFALGYDHTTGSTVALTSTLAAVIGAYYQIAYTITGRTAGSITINFGGVSNSSITATGTWGPLATTTGVLTITPTTDFDGTLVLSVKSQTSTSVATTTFTNSSGTVVNEIRNASSNTNLFIGLNSGRRVTTSVANTFIGFSTGSNNTTGTNNTFIGQASGTLNSIGSYNLFVGQASGQANTLGNSDTFVGQNAGYNNTSGGNNAFFGASAGYNNTSAYYNTFIGDSSGLNNTVGSSNTFIGQGAGASNTTGGSNVLLGANTGGGNTAGASNVILGASAGRYIADKTTSPTSINTSILIGNRTSPLANTQTNQIVIGNDSTGLGSNTTVLGNSSTITTAIYGDLLLGTTIDSGVEKLQVQGTAGMTAVKIIGSGNSTTPPIFTVQGSQGELFSVNDSLTGSLFSVNDISGLPILEVFSDNTVLMGSYIAPSLNTTTKVTAGVGLTSVYSIPTSAYTGAFFDYTISDNTNLRAGNVMAIWNSGTTVQYTETSTNDIGNTSGLTFNMIISGSTAILRTSGVTGNWTVKTIIRSI